MLDFFGSKISDDIKNEIDSFLRDNRYELKQTANTTADYYKTTMVIMPYIVLLKKTTPL